MRLTLVSLPKFSFCFIFLILGAEEDSNTETCTVTDKKKSHYFTHIIIAIKKIAG